MTPSRGLAYQVIANSTSAGSSGLPIMGLACLKDCGASIEEAKATAAYMDEKVRHYEQILSGEVPDDSNPGRWTEGSRPEMH